MHFQWAFKFKLKTMMLNGYLNQFYDNNVNKNEGCKLFEFYSVHQE